MPAGSLKKPQHVPGDWETAYGHAHAQERPGKRKDWVLHLWLALRPVQKAKVEAKADLWIACNSISLTEGGD